MSNTFGKLFCITTWGESHGKAVGVVIDGCPAGLELSEKDIQKELDRRRPGQSKIVSARAEEDKAEILSGIFEGKTLGTPISIIVKNKDTRSRDYSKIKDIYRPGHADYTWEAKYGIRDYRGGGRASARETVGRVAGGAVARKMLSGVGVEVGGYVSQIGDIKFQIQNSKYQINSKFQISNFKTSVEKSIVRCPDQTVSKKMVALIEKVRKEGDSVGGIVELVAMGVPVGLGEPVFDKLSADLAKALMSIPAIKGVEIGRGFAAAGMRGSEHNDKFYSTNGGGSTKERKTPAIHLRQGFGGRVGRVEVQTKTNNAGGILGGISNGMPIVVRIAVKPTSSINQEQETIDNQGRQKKIKVEGRHDPCICPRAVPVAEAMMALVLADHYLLNRVSTL